MSLVTPRNEPSAVRIQKVLAHHGLGSRREIETWIQAKRIKIDGQIANLGDKLGNYSSIQLDGKIVHLQQKKAAIPKVLIYHKPSGEICSRRDEQGRKTIFDSLPQLKNKRWVSVGRLDLNTSGLLLLTDDGDAAHQLMHPSSEIEREYAVRVLGEPKHEDLLSLKEGVEIDGQSMRFKSIRAAGGDGANRWYHVILTEGKYRMVRRLWESKGMAVSRLIRVRYGNVLLPKHLRMGQSSLMPANEVSALLAYCKNPY